MKSAPDEKNPGHASTYLAAAYYNFIKKCRYNSLKYIQHARTHTYTQQYTLIRLEGRERGGLKDTRNIWINNNEVEEMIDFEIINNIYSCYSS